MSRDAAYLLEMTTGSLCGDWRPACRQRRSAVVFHRLRLHLLLFLVISVLGPYEDCSRDFACEYP